MTVEAKVFELANGNSSIWSYPSTADCVNFTRHTMACLPGCSTSIYMVPIELVLHAMAAARWKGDRCGSRCNVQYVYVYNYDYSVIDYTIGFLAVPVI